MAHSKVPVPNWDIAQQLRLLRGHLKNNTKMNRKPCLGSRLVCPPPTPCATQCVSSWNLHKYNQNGNSLTSCTAPTQLLRVTTSQWAGQPQINQESGKWIVDMLIGQFDGNYSTEAPSPQLCQVDNHDWTKYCHMHWIISYKVVNWSLIQM